MINSSLEQNWKSPRCSHMTHALDERAQFSQISQIEPNFDRIILLGNVLRRSSLNLVDSIIIRWWFRPSKRGENDTCQRDHARPRSSFFHPRGFPIVWKWDWERVYHFHDGQIARFNCICSFECHWVHFEVQGSRFYIETEKIERVLFVFIVNVIENMFLFIFA